LLFDKSIDITLKECKMKSRNKLIPTVFWLFFVIILAFLLLFFFLLVQEGNWSPQEFKVWVGKVRDRVQPIEEIITGPVATIEPIPFSGPLTQITWFYIPPKNDDLDKLVRNFDFFILTKNNEDTRDDLKIQGVNQPILQYLRFEAIMDPGSCDRQPWRNQVADQIGDFCWIRDQHPDWILRDSIGNPIIDEEDEDFVLMDPGNPEWQKFWLERAIQSQETLGWEGVFLDNVEASLAKRDRRGQLPAKYPTDASYQAAIKSFLQYIYSGYFQPQQRPLMANIISLRNNTVWFEYLHFLDGAMEEAWAVDWGDDYRSNNDWEEHLFRAEETQRMGKTAILVSQGSRGDIQRQEFAFASYLLISHGTASFRYANTSSYSEIWLYPTYQLELGEPLGPRYRDGDLWRRDFSQGSVSVDPINHAISIQSP
jgi:hypothetical protein